MVPTWVLVHARCGRTTRETGKKAGHVRETRTYYELVESDKPRLLTILEELV
jgi:hypothetical protein